MIINEGYIEEMCKRVSKKEIDAMILAGGQGSRLGVLTKKIS